MQIRWRTHEKILVTLLAVYILLIYIFRFYTITDDVKIELYASPFTAQGKPFHYLHNILLPQIIILLLQYGCYWWISLIVMRFFKPDEKRRAKIAVTVLQLVLIIFLLGPVSNFLYYVLSPHSSHAGILISPIRLTPHPVPGPFTSWVWASLPVGILVLYLLIRERIIERLERNGPRTNYRITMINRVSTFLLFYLCLFPFVHYIAGPAAPGESINALTSLYAIIIPSLILFGAISINWLYPIKLPEAKMNVSGLTSLIVLSAICSLPALLMEDDWKFSAFLITWIIQLFLIAPLVWIIYLQRRDRLLELMGSKKELARSKTELAKSKTDFALLRAQINPHFLFNAMNTLYGTAIMEKAEGTARGIQMLGDMMRFMLHDNQSENIPLQKEVGYLKNFIALQRLRIPGSEGVQINDELDEDAGAGIKIEPMLLIPLVENAFKHGISFAFPSRIDIRLSLQARDLHFEVRNTLHARKQDTGQSGTGLANVRERLTWKYPGNHSLTIDQTDKEFHVILKIFNL